MSSYNQQLQKEYRQTILSFKITAVAAFTMVGVGSIFFHFVQKLSWLDAVYFCTVTLATVGYGDIVPTTDAGKLFIIFYIIIGIGIIATFANLLVKRAVLRREIKKLEKE